MKSKLAIQRELSRVKKAMKSHRDSNHIDNHALYGAQQALAWALGQDAMRPEKCFRAPKGR